MTTFKLGRWLLVTLAIIGLALVAPAVSAHDDRPTADDAPPYDGPVAEWAEWMEAHMTDHMGPGAVEWMEDHMGVTVGEMAPGMADGSHGRGMYGHGVGC
jgi:hypothetical protein